MSFKIKNSADSSVIEIIAMNINNDNEILAIEDNKLSILSFEIFRDMILGTKATKREKAKEPTHQYFVEG